MNLNSAEQEIELMNAFRYSLIKKKNSFWNEESEEYDKDGYNPKDDDQKIDELAVEIEKSIKLYFNELAFDFIVEQLSNLGQAPNLLYDDNSMWAVTSEGFSSVSLEVSDWEGSFFVKKEQWRKTPREALYFYLNNEE